MDDDTSGAGYILGIRTGAVLRVMLEWFWSGCLLLTCSTLSQRNWVSEWSAVAANRLQVRKKKEKKKKTFPSKKAEYYLEGAILLQSCRNMDLCIFLIEKCGTCTTITADIYHVPGPLPTLPSIPKPPSPPSASPCTWPHLLSLIHHGNTVSVIHQPEKCYTESKGCVPWSRQWEQLIIPSSTWRVSQWKNRCFRPDRSKYLFRHWHAKILIV